MRRMHALSGEPLEFGVAELDAHCIEVLIMGKPMNRGAMSAVHPAAIASAIDRV